MGIESVGSSSHVNQDGAAQAAEEARRRAEEAARRAAEEARRRAEAARKAAEEAKRKAEAARKAAEEAEAKAEKTKAQQDKDKAAKLKAEQKEKQEAALKAEAQAVLKEKEHGLAKAKLKDAKDNVPVSAPSKATKDAQADVDKAKATAAFYEQPQPPVQVPYLPGKQPGASQSMPTSTSLFAQPVKDPVAPTHDVNEYAKQIQAVYDQSGSAAAAEQLAIAEGDKNLSPEQRKQLLAAARPTIDKIAADAGDVARKTNLPAEGQSSKTPGIDDKAEYKGLVDDLAAATESAGSPEDARRIAATILGHIAAKQGGGADTLDLFGDALRSLPSDRSVLRDAVLFELKAKDPGNAGEGSVLALSADKRGAAADALATSIKVQQLFDSPGFNSVNDTVKDHLRALAREGAETDPAKLDRLSKLLNDPGFMSLDDERKETLVLDSYSNDPAYAAKIDAVLARKDLSGDDHRLAIDLFTRPQYRDGKTFIGNGSNDEQKLANNIYEATGADPLQIIDYVHRLDDKQVKAMLSESSHLDDKLKDGKIPASQDGSAYLSLPSDPTKVDVSKYTTISYNGQTKRWEDPVTRSYWEGGKWFFDPKIGNSMGYVPDTHSDLTFYDPQQQGLMHKNGFLETVNANSASGLDNWARANGMPALPRVDQAPAYPVQSDPIDVAPPDGVPTASPTELAAMKDYTDSEIDLSHELLLDARKKEAELEKLKPGTEDYEKAAQAYRSAANLAVRERAKSEQAIAAELRQIYKGDAKNAVATEDAAHEIAKRFRDDPEAQLIVKSALNTVKTETPLQRDTGNKLYEFHRASDKVTQLQAQYNGTGQTNSEDYKAAIADYNKKRDVAMAALGNELKAAEAGVQGDDARAKAVDDAALKLTDRYVGDEDLMRMAAAARIIRHAEDAHGTTNQMLAIGKDLKADASPQVRELVMSDPGVKKIVDRYVDESARSVTQAYDKGVRDYQDKYGDSTKRDKDYVAPATAATRKLMELTDPKLHPEVSPEITARIVNKLFGSDGNGTLDHVIDDVSLHGDHSAELVTVEGAPEGFKSFRGMDNDMLMGYDMKDYKEIMSGLSTVIDRAAAGSHPSGKDKNGKPTMAWESDEVKKAVETAGHDFAMNVIENWGPQHGRLNNGFKMAIGDGAGVTLALETAKQEKQFQTEMDWAPAGGHEVDLAKETLDSVADGLDDMKKNSRKLFEDQHKEMAALEVPQMRFGKLMTAEQQQKALLAIIEKHPDLAGAFEKGKQALDDRGYQLLRDGEMVTFYGQDDQLGQQAGFDKVEDKRKTLLDDDYVKTMVLGSDSASTRIKEQAVHSSLNWMRDAGTVPPAALGPIPVNLFLQWTGDFTENIVENHNLKRMYGGGYSRLGNHGPIAAASWGAVGATQLWFTDYLYHNVNFDSSQAWRKPVLLGLVGGFAGIKVLQAGAVLAHKGALALPPSMQRILNETKALPSISTLERGSEFTRTAEWKSIGFFGLLHADAAIWDASRVYYSLKDWKEGKPLDQRNFWTAAVNMTNDVAIASIEFKAAWGLLKDPLVVSDAARAAALQSGQGITRDGAIKGFQEGVERAVQKYALGRFGVKAVMAPASLYEFIGRQLAKKLPFFEAGPAGWVANIAWTATDLVNWVGNEQKVHKQLESVDRDFLTAGGVNPDAADILADRSLMKANFNRWLSGDSLAEGLLDAYSSAGGDPNKFVDWVNGLQKSGQLEKVRAAADYETDKQAPENYEAFLALPEDPTKVDLSYSKIAYNKDKKRFEDPMTQTYYRGGSWVYDKDIQAAPGAAKANDPGKGHYFMEYSPDSREIHCMGDVNIRLSARSGRGLENWLHAHNIAPPPMPKPDGKPAAPVDTSQTDKHNTYVVKKNESVWEIADNDPQRVQWIYDHNLWLNERMEQDHRPINTRGGQNPNYIEEGDVLILPEGYRPPHA